MNTARARPELLFGLGLDAMPLVDDFIVFLVGKIREEFLALVYSAVAVDLCVCVLVDYLVDDCSHCFISFLIWYYYYTIFLIACQYFFEKFFLGREGFFQALSAR